MPKQMRGKNVMENNYNNMNQQQFNNENNGMAYPPVNKNRAMVAVILFIPIVFFTSLLEYSCLSIFITDLSAIGYEGFRTFLHTSLFVGIIVSIIAKFVYKKAYRYWRYKFQLHHIFNMDMGYKIAAGIVVPVIGMLGLWSAVSRLIELYKELGPGWHLVLAVNSFIEVVVFAHMLTHFMSLFSVKELSDDEAML